MGIGEFFTILFVNPITNLLVALYKLFLVLNIPYALGFSIIALTGVIKLILHPFIATQIKSAAKMQKIAPHIANVREKHKSDAKRQQEEMMKLYKEHGVNPAAGCLPFAVQIPVLLSLYNVLSNIVNANSLNAINKINEVLYFPFLKIDRLWDTYFFGLQLSGTPSKMFSGNVFIILIPLLTGVSQFILSKMMLPEEQGIVAAKDKKKDDFQSTMLTQSLYIFPVIIGISSYTLPVGLSLYWIAFTIFGILQQYILVGPGGLKRWIGVAESYIWKKK